MTFEVSGTKYYNHNISCGEEGFNVSPDGILRAPVRHQTDNKHCDCRTLIKIVSWPKEHSAKNAIPSLHGGPLSQTMFLDVSVKEPRYLLATPIPGDYIATKGLLVGGPYGLRITYHDELGRAFDSVSGKFFYGQSLSFTAVEEDLDKFPFLLNGKLCNVGFHLKVPR